MSTPSSLLLFHRSTRRVLPTSQRLFFYRQHSSNNPGKLRIAVIGGGAAGLSAALHLAPLAARNLIHSPIELYEATSGPSQNSPSPGSGAWGRDIGVGVWSTALLPLRSDRQSHQRVLQSVEEMGQWVGEVGYRTPNGDWLARSHLPSGLDEDSPSLVFLKEKELLETLRLAVKEEEELGLVQTRYASDPTDKSTSVEAINPQYFKNGEGLGRGHLMFSNGSTTSNSFHLIVAAGGFNSKLRSRYVAEEVTPKNLETASMEDRNYTVFRGNSPIPSHNQIGFQTWGEGQSMRFATVPLKKDGQVWFATTSNPDIVQETDPNEQKKLLLKDFAHWHEPIIPIIQSTPIEDTLVERAMAHRHSAPPVLSLHNPEQIHISSSVSTMERKRLIRRADEVHGKGPILFFVGDASMTVDPVLAQGFTMAMEDGAMLAKTIESCCTSSTLPSSKYNFDPKTLRKEIKRKYYEREPRLLALLRATDLVQSMAQPNTGTLMGFVSRKVIRPIVKVVPGFVKRPFFDLMVRYSLGVAGRKKR